MKIPHISSFLPLASVFARPLRATEETKTDFKSTDEITAPESKQDAHGHDPQHDSQRQAQNTVAAWWLSRNDPDDP